LRAKANDLISFIAYGLAEGAKNRHETASLARYMQDADEIIAAG
jgi:hypothetical protein